jgi:AcrR family transcriptional regulator
MRQIPLMESEVSRNTAERAPYQSTLRARHKEQTAQLILDAVATILRRSGLSAVSIAEVARVADVTERTVYRHYDSRDDLIRAFIKWHLDKIVGGPAIVPPNSVDDLLTWVARRQKSWENDEQIVTEAYLSPLGREMRRPLYDLGLANNMRIVEMEVPGLPEKDRRNLAAVMMTLISTENFIFLRQNLGWQPDQILEATTMAIRSMLDGAKAKAAG